MQFEVTSLTHLGSVRTIQQDSVLAIPSLMHFPSKLINTSLEGSTKEVAIFCIADGMGGGQAGDVASRFVTDFVSQWAQGIGQEIGDLLQNVEQRLTALVQEINDKLHQLAQKDDKLRGMGSTIVLALVYKQYLFVCWVGDSRCYLYRDQSLKLLTHDHSLVQNLLDTGQIAEEEAFSHPKRHIITQSLGMAEVSPDFVSLELRCSDHVILCSDGLSGMLSDNDMSQIIGGEVVQNSTLADSLVQAALTAGGHDNIGLVFITFKDEPNEEVHVDVKDEGSIASRAVWSKYLWVLFLMVCLGVFCWYLLHAHDTEQTNVSVDEMNTVVFSDERTWMDLPIQDTYKFSSDIRINANNYGLLLAVYRDSITAHRYMTTMNRILPINGVYIMGASGHHEVLVDGFRTYHEAQDFKDKHRLNEALVLNMHNHLKP